jgi:hypothetical protein
MATEANTFMIEGAQIIFKNFEGKEAQYNRAGDRNFAVIIPDDKMAQQMLKDGWNVRFLQPRDEGDEPTPYVQVAVSYKNRPPKIVMISSNSRTNLDERTVETLDWANIRSCDLICRAYEWNVNGKTGIKAYLQSLFVTIEEDYLERKYSDMERED